MTTPSPPPRRPRWFVRRWVLFLTLLYAAVIVVFMWIENSLVFRPMPGSSWQKPIDPRTEDVELVSADGTKLHAWWVPPTNPAAGALLYAHGNGGNLSYTGKTVAGLSKATGAGVLAFEYPGYGKSEGKVSERGCYAAGDAAYAWLTEKFPANRVVIVGESLGGGVAVDLAARHDHRALVLLCTFTTLPAAAKALFPFLPTHTFMRNRFDSLSKIKQCPRPLFMAHGTADRTVPYWQGEQLFAAANEPKEFLRLDGVEHAAVAGPVFYASLASFLAKIP